MPLLRKDFSTTIKSKAEAKKYITWCVKTFGITFNPSVPFTELTNGATNTPLLKKTVANKLESKMRSVLRFLSKTKEKSLINEWTLVAAQKAHPKFF